MRRRIFAGLLAFLLLAATPWMASAAPHATLRWGSTGADVRLAQRKLQAWGYYKGSIDGVYGRLMYAAVTLFQRRNGLTADGVVGPTTWRALGENPGTARQAPAGRASNSDNMWLLARIISAEAKGEPYEGQVAVGAVILNRVEDPRFPGTLAGVIYQTHAFEPVANGTIYNEPTASAVRAARDALNGWDPTGGAVFFWNPATAVSQWVWSRPVIKQIGKHVFAR